MKLLVISDTHDNLALALKAHSLSEPVDTVVHLGDGIADGVTMRELLNTDVICVAGNCDTGSSAPRELLLEIENKRVFLTHGDVYGVKAGLEKLKQRAIEVRADLVLFGHSHLATKELFTGILLVNPGTMMNVAAIRSYAIVDVSSDEIFATIYNIS